MKDNQVTTCFLLDTPVINNPIRDDTTITAMLAIQSVFNVIIKMVPATIKIFILFF